MFSTINLTVFVFLFFNAVSANKTCRDLYATAADVENRNRVQCDAAINCAMKKNTSEVYYFTCASETSTPNVFSLSNVNCDKIIDSKSTLWGAACKQLEANNVWYKFELDVKTVTKEIIPQFYQSQNAVSATCLDTATRRCGEEQLNCVMKVCTEENEFEVHYFTCLAANTEVVVSKKTCYKGNVNENRTQAKRTLQGAACRAKNQMNTDKWYKFEVDVKTVTDTVRSYHSPSRDQVETKKDKSPDQTPSNAATINNDKTPVETKKDKPQKKTTEKQESTQDSKKKKKKKKALRLYVEYDEQNTKPKYISKQNKRIKKANKY